MNKPVSLSIRHYIQRKLSVKLMLSEDVIDEVITDSGKQIQEALYTNKSVEISGFGKFLFREKQAIKDISRFINLRDTYVRDLETTTDPKKIIKLTKRIESANEVITYLKSKTDEQAK